MWSRTWRAHEVTEEQSQRGPISRRDVFRYGLGASTLIALGPLLPETSGAATSTATKRFGALRAHASSPKKGGTLKFARSVAPTTARPGELDHRG